ncbi:hypothetical protein ETI05_09875 [Macrococcoides canis]|uniref:Uncharacterized protein n=1 Tax=Macrococcoides canis TaxID=1855823 RepID=A0A4R6C4Q4_9STAP|nr:hypothetical protein [Macrococcus canis]MEE1106914.1 hypothetical protein [Macrococcus canis]TDM16587.1 hypothetical protein ETI04_07775 [Macrococcus canis]TDM19725.1 hypothetical protein ETI05_09875 [Macrococcus canis]TDM36042.1 hypothetical protein ETI11_09050 [Macrococcus canis]
MKKVFKTMTNNASIPLKLKLTRGLFPQMAEVLAEVDLETGEVKFKVSDEDLIRIKKNIED